MTVQSKITLSLPWSHNIFHAAKIPGTQACFSGKWLVHAQQWGAFAVDVTRPTWVGGTGTMVSPLTIGPNFQGAAFCQGNGDAHQSSQWVVATPGTPKWVVTTEPSLGTFGQCSNGKTPSPLQVYALDDAHGLRYHGQIVIGNTFGPGSRLDGDMLYADRGNGTWSKVDLPTLTHQGDTVVAPAFTPQPDIEGVSSFTIAPTGPNRFEMSSAAQPTPEPMNNFYPTSQITRQEIAATGVKLINWMVDHPGQKLPLHPEQIFADVAPGYPTFYDVINQMGASGIMKGKP